MNKKITWFAVARAPYLDFLLSEVNKNFELKVYYKIEGNTHPWELGKVNHDNKPISGNLLKAISDVRNSDIMLMSGWSFWQHLLIMILPFKNVKKIYFCDTINLDKKLWSGLKGNLRRLIVKVVFKVFDEVWSNGIPGCEALEKLGCKKEKISSFNFSPDVNKYKNLDYQTIQDSNSFRRRNTNDESNRVFLCSGRLIESKRFDYIIKAIARLNNRDVILWIAGTGPELERLRSLAIELNIEQQIKFLGWLNQYEVDLSNIAADVYVHPASFDPFPNVVLDAMSWGKPIIGSCETGSVRDRVQHGVNGFVYPSDNLDDLVKYLQVCTKASSCALKEIGLKARETACQNSVDVSIASLNRVAGN